MTCLGDKSEKRSKSTVVLRVPSSKIAFASFAASQFQGERELRVTIEGDH